MWYAMLLLLSLVAYTCLVCSLNNYHSLLFFILNIWLIVFFCYERCKLAILILDTIALFCILDKKFQFTHYCLKIIPRLLHGRNLYFRLWAILIVLQIFYISEMTTLCYYFFFFFIVKHDSTGRWSYEGFYWEIPFTLWFVYIYPKWWIRWSLLCDQSVYSAYHVHYIYNPCCMMNWLEFQIQMSYHGVDEPTVLMWWTEINQWILSPWPVCFILLYFILFLKFCRL